MQVRAKKMPARHKMPGGQPTPKPPAESYVFGAPVRGWVLNTNAATPAGDSARVLDNWIARRSGLEMRKGTAKHANLSAAVKALWRYQSGGAETFFASTAAGIFDVSSPVNAETTPVASLEGLTEGVWVTEQFSTSGGDFQLGVNGADHAILFDGVNLNPFVGETVINLGYDALSAAFTVGETVTGGTSGATAEILGIAPSSATAGTLKVGAITGTFQDNEALTDGASGAATSNIPSGVSNALTTTITGVDTSALSYVWSYASRLFFIEKNTMKAHYLGADAIGGSLSTLNLGSVFSKGGSLLFGTKWSVDAGDGLDDKWVVCTTEGEVAVYSGTNPGSADTWALQGVYDLPRPLGPKAHLAVAGDVLIATEVGLIPLSAAVSQDASKIAEFALSAPIDEYWQAKGLQLPETWEIKRVDAEGIAIVTQPLTAGQAGDAGKPLVITLETGAWSRWTGIDMACVGQFGDNGYFGATDGYIYRMQSGGTDDGSPYTCSWLGQHDPLGAYGAQKTVVQMRSIWDAGTPLDVQVSAVADFCEVLPSPPSSAPDFDAAIWDTAAWDTDVWDGSEGSYSNAARWQSAGVTGFTIAPVVQVTSGTTPAPVAKLVSVEAQFHLGAVVT